MVATPSKVWLPLVKAVLPLLLMVVSGAAPCAQAPMLIVRASAKNVSFFNKCFILFMKLVNK